MSSTDSIIAFAHVPKTAGITITHLFRRHFGVRALNVFARGRPDFYRPRDLRLDLRMMPVGLRFLHGHSLRPCVDFEEFEERLVWFTVLRDPIRRYISQYIYNYEVMGERFDVLHFIRRRPDKPNRQVRMLAGDEDLDAAIHHVRRMACVGLMERLDESLLLVRDRLGLDGLDLRDSGARNVGEERRPLLDRAAVRAEFARHHDEVVECNKLDLQLYDFVRREIWPRQVAAYGEARLAGHVATEFAGGVRRLRPGLRLGANFAFRNVVYKPWIRLDRSLSRYAPPPLRAIPGGAPAPSP
jgi:Sulfotransferase family